MELPTVLIGGEPIALPAIMNLRTLKRAWPALQAIDEAPDNIARVSASLAFIAAVVVDKRPELTLAWMEDRLRVQMFDPDKVYEQRVEELPGGARRVRQFDPATGEEVTHGDRRFGRDERPGVIDAVRRLCIASGLVARVGEVGDALGEAAAPGSSTAPGATASPSTATSTISSPS